MRLRRFLLQATCALALTAGARADLTVALTAAVQNSARGRELVFSGTLRNTSPTAKLYLNDIVAVLNVGAPNEFLFHANSFFSNVPGVLLPNESYSESELFRVALQPGAPAGDYRGVVTFRGGADLLADDSLASADYAVLSPALTVVATTPEACEFGPQAGRFTLTRSGGTDIALPVVFALAGTALAGVDYEAVALAAVIPAGSDSITATILPIPNNIAQGDRSVLLALSPAFAYNLGLTTSDAVTIHDKPADAWRFANFGANANDPLAADNGDFDGDGVANLLEFALNLDPKRADPTALPAATRLGDYVTISFSPNPAATDVNYIVEGSPDLSAWSSDDVEMTSVPGPNNVLTFRYRFPITEVPRGFLRLRLQRTDP